MELRNSRPEKQNNQSQKLMRGIQTAEVSRQKKGSTKLTSQLKSSNLKNRKKTKRTERTKPKKPVGYH